VAEREEVDVADQQIESAGEQREAQRLHDEKWIGDERRDGDQPTIQRGDSVRAAISAVGHCGC